jgi:transcriptional/translational regulatory protein YebC/TACO1
MFAKNGGQLAGAGAVAWQFEPRGVVAITLDGKDADDVALTAIDAGADDVDTDADPIEVITGATNLEQIRKTLEGAGMPIESAEVTMQPTTPIDVDEHVARQNLRLIEALEDLDDVQRVTANFNLPAEVLAEAASA